MRGPRPPRGPEEGAQRAPSADTVTDGAASLLGPVRKLIGDLLHLAVLEARLAALSTVWMLGLGVAAALLLVSAWFLLLGALAFWLVGQGLSWATVLIGIAGANVLLSLPLIFLILRYSRNVLFAATRRQIQGMSSRAAGRHVEKS